MKKRAFLSIFPLLFACVAREFPAQIGPDPLLQDVFGLSDQDLWIEAPVLRVVAAHQFVIQLPRSLGSGERLVQIFGVRPTHPLDEKGQREVLLQRIQPGDVLSLQKVATGENGVLLARVRDSLGNVGVWLASQGVVWPYPLCRAADACTADRLRHLEAGALARACERHLELRAGTNPQPSTDPQEPTIERIAWVGHLASGEVFPVSEREQVPICWRVYFAEGAAPLLTDPKSGRRHF